MTQMTQGYGEGAEGLITTPTFGPVCALCFGAFKIGDTYRSIWRKDGGMGVKLGISVHPGCAAQLDPGDLGRIFGALEGGLAMPIGVIKGRRVVRTRESGARSQGPGEVLPRLPVPDSPPRDRREH
jgi:hypothetical protein